jgi:tetratricopeptide (TPR) repeat protein
MKVVRSMTRLSITIICCLTWSGLGYGQNPGSGQPDARPRAVTQTPAPAQKNVTKGVPSPTPSTTPVSINDLIAQGKTHYLASRYKQALAKFEAALKTEPNHDEALGLAGITAFRLDNQEQARLWFLRRADLPNQRPSVKAFSYYRVALTYWRDVHDDLAQTSAITKGKVEYKLSDEKRVAIQTKIRAGIDYADRALKINDNYAEVLNVKNLLQSEAALADSDPTQANHLRQRALDDLRKSLKLQRAAPVKSDEAANFNFPTIRIGEIPRTPDEDKLFIDEMLKVIEGGRPIKRTAPAFPAMRASKIKDASNDPSSTGITDKGGAYSIGSGRGALTAAYAPGTVKIEVLISTTGAVVFAHVVDGRDDLNGAAILAARGWKFSPAKLDGSPVQVSGVITFDMRPPGNRPTASPTPKKP